MAVYDKRLLDRARRYVGHDGYKRNANGVIQAMYSELEYQNADQATRDQWKDESIIDDWTNYDSNDTVTDAVAYTWGGADTIDTFNTKLQAQRSTITAYYDGGQNTTIAPNPNPSDHRAWSPWNVTTAPSNDWDNYIFTGNVDNDTTYNQLTINGNNYTPYRPGFSQYRRANNSYQWQHVLYSAGVDCSGYVQRCASYTNNPYQNRRTVGTTQFWVGSFRDGATGQDLWTNNGNDVHRRLGTSGLLNNSHSFLINDMNLLVPGDIIIRSGHVAIVNRIVFNDGERVVAENSQGEQEARVYIIHATTAGPNSEKQVVDVQTWRNLGNYLNYQKRRLK